MLLCHAGLSIHITCPTIVITLAGEQLSTSSSDTGNLTARAEGVRICLHQLDTAEVAVRQPQPAHSVMQGGSKVVVMATHAI